MTDEAWFHNHLRNPNTRQLEFTYRITKEGDISLRTDTVELILPKDVAVRLAAFIVGEYTKHFKDTIGDH